MAAAVVAADNMNVGRNDTGELVPTSGDGAMGRQPNVGASESEGRDGPPDGFLFVLPFLDLLSRLTMERVSKPLREAVRENPLAWQHLDVELPVSRNISVDTLLMLVKRAEGHLKSLSVVGSLRITDAALDRISALNPELEKLSIPGCTGLSSETVVRLVESHSLKGRAKGLPGIREVQIRGLYNITKEHLDCLQGILQPTAEIPKPSSPQHYGNIADGQKRSAARPIDVGLCPHCSQVRVIYDCTRHKLDYDLEQPCRGCTFCIPRCEECGRCIRNISYEESLCADSVCIECWLNLPKCSECNRAFCRRHAKECLDGANATFTCQQCVLNEDSLDFSFEI